MGIRFERGVHTPFTTAKIFRRVHRVSWHACLRPRARVPMIGGGSRHVKIGHGTPLPRPAPGPVAALEPSPGAALHDVPVRVVYDGIDDWDSMAIPRPRIPFWVIGGYGAVR